VLRTNFSSDPASDPRKGLPLHVVKANEVVEMKNAKNAGGSLAITREKGTTRVRNLTRARKETKKRRTNWISDFVGKLKFTKLTSGAQEPQILAVKD